MSITYHELKERLKTLDEISLMEILEISSEDLVDRFDDKIEEKYDFLQSEFQSEAGEDETEESD